MLKLKIFALIPFLFFSSQVFSQKADFSENAVSYLGKSYKIGDIVLLGYGSAADKDFVFINDLQGGRQNRDVSSDCCFGSISHNPK